MVMDVVGELLLFDCSVFLVLGANPLDLRQARGYALQHIPHGLTHLTGGLIKERGGTSGKILFLPLCHEIERLPLQF